MVLWVSRSVLGSGEPFDLYLSSLAESRIRSHAVKEAPLRLEVMGFLLGDVCTWRGWTYTVVRDIGTTKLRSSSSKVRFDPSAFPRLFHDLDDSGFDYILVGWYHSHPGHTCFISRIDLETQRSIFNEPYHVALVIDPLNREIKTYRLKGVDCAETRFAVYQGNRYADTASKKRTRKLKVKAVVPLDDSQ